MQRCGEAERLRAKRACFWTTTASLLGLIVGPSARANDLADELTVGEISATQSQPATPYVSDHADGWFDLGDRASLNLNAGFTRYAATSVAKPSTIFELGTGGSYDVSEHVTLAADAFVSPQSVSVQRTQIMPAAVVRPAAIRSRTSVFGFGLDGEYGTAGDSDAESAISLGAGLSSFATTQAIRLGPRGGGMRLGRPESASLLQGRATVGFTETLFRDTDLGVTGSYYFYNRDPTQSGYYGATVFGRLGLGDGIPIEPLRFTVRPSVVHRFGPLRVSAYMRYGMYMDPGSSLLGGAKVQYKVSRAVRAWLAGNVQHDWLSGADDLNIFWASLGARVLF